MNHREVWVLLEPYLDGELEAAGRWAVLAHLADCSACRAYVAGQVRLRGQVQARLASIEPPPGLDARLRSAVAAQRPSARTQSGVWPASFLPKAATVLGPAIVALWLLARVTAPVVGFEPALDGELAMTHSMFAQDDSLLDIAGDAPAASGWFREQMGLGVTVPDLDGYEFLGARMIILRGEPVAQLVYESHPDEVYLSLLTLSTPNAGAAGTSPWPPESANVQGTPSVVTWETDSGWAALVGEASASELRRLAAGLDNWPRAASTPAA